MKQVPMRSKDFQDVLKDYSFTLAKKDLIERIDDKIILINKKPSFFFYEQKIVPTLHILLTHKLLKEIIVDMGAVKFLIDGADVMRPGVKEIDPYIEQGDFVVVRDMNNKKPLCVGIALFSASEMEKQNSGKVVKNIHYIGDELWNFAKR